jgi:hypothetical protein
MLMEDAFHTVLKCQQQEGILNSEMTESGWPWLRLAQALDPVIIPMALSVILHWKTCWVLEIESQK